MQYTSISEVIYLYSLYRTALWGGIGPILNWNSGVLSGSILSALPGRREEEPFSKMYHVQPACSHVSLSQTIGSDCSASPSCGICILSSSGIRISTDFLLRVGRGSYSP